MSAIVQDSFTQCFENDVKKAWDFTFYLLPLRYLSLIVRYCFLLPCRIMILIGGCVMFAFMIAVSQLVNKQRSTAIKQYGIKFMAHTFLFSWCAVVIEEGTRPVTYSQVIFACLPPDLCLIFAVDQGSTGCVHTQATIRENQASVEHCVRQFDLKVPQASSASRADLRCKPLHRF
jgi:hypothetical protein